MASFQAHLLDFALRRRIKARFTETWDPAQVRRLLGSAPLPPQRGVRFTPGEVGGVAGEWIEADDVQAQGDLLYIHGGGFVACSPRTHRPITGGFARRGWRVFAPAYRLAPEHPHPAASQDVLSAWRGLRVRSSGVPAVAGDSAGGNLALLLMLALRDAGEAQPCGAALFSPATDLEGTGASVETNVHSEAMFTTLVMRQMADAYLDGFDAASPLVSPLRADLTGVAPLLVHVGDREVLRDDAVRLAEQAAVAGVKVSLRVWPVTPHVWQITAPFVPEARQSLDIASAFLRQAGASACP